MTPRLDEIDTVPGSDFETEGLRIAAHPRAATGADGWRDAIAPDHLYLCINLSVSPLAVLSDGDMEIGRAPPRTVSFLPLWDKPRTVSAEGEGAVLRLVVSRVFLYRYPELSHTLRFAPAQLHFADATLVALAQRLHERLADAEPATDAGSAPDASGTGDDPVAAIGDEFCAYAIVMLSCLAARLRDDGRLPRDGWPERVRSAAAFIEARLDHDLLLPDIAAHVGVSQYHFARLFREAVGMSVHRYVVSRRVERAAHLLKSTDVPLVEVALEAGFGSQSHMTSVMQKTLDRTPGDLRRSAQNEDSATGADARTTSNA